jgi:aliphatic sulfonates family ABC transporter substrate-binding protein
MIRNRPAPPDHACARMLDGSRVLIAAAFAALMSAAMPTLYAAQTTVSIGTAKDPNLAAQIAIARAKGYFQGAGIDVDVKYFPSGGDLMTAVVGGSVSIGSSGATPTTTLRSRPYPIKIVAQMSDISGAQQIIVKAGLKNLEELYGKKIAIMRGTASEALFNSFVKAYGFDRNKVELVSMAPAEMLASFVRGTVDAVSVWEPHTTRARKSGNGKMLVSGTKSNIPGKEGARRIYGDHSTLFATEAYIKEHPKTLQSVLAALARANDFIDNNRPEAIQILSKEFGMEPADMADVMDSNRHTLELNEELVRDLDAVSAFLYGLKRIQSQPKASDWIDPAPLRAVRSKLVNLK